MLPKFILTLVSTFLVFGPGALGQEIDFTSPNLPLENDSHANDVVGDLDAYNARINGTESFSELPESERIPDSRTFVASISSSRYYTSLAGAAYCSDSSLKAWNCRHCNRLGRDVKFQKALVDPRYQTRAIITTNSKTKEIILSFRGAINFQNWLSSLNFAKTSFPAARGGAVHMGFKNAVDSFQPIFNSAIKDLLANPEYRNYNIVVTGHSLGGAISTFAALYIQQVHKLNWDRISVYTYGQPRVGNQNFAIWYNRLPFAFTRYVNEADTIPHAPPVLAGYAHAFTEVYQEGSSIRACSRNYLEDPSCANSNVPFLSAGDHSYAFGIQIGRDGC